MGFKEASHPSKGYGPESGRAKLRRFVVNPPRTADRRSLRFVAISEESSATTSKLRSVGNGFLAVVYFGPQMGKGLVDMSRLKIQILPGK
jgi:hypothetical protein